MQLFSKGRTMVNTSKSINVLYRCSQAYRADKLLGTEISPSIYFYLFSICKNPAISQDELAKMLYINKSSVARALKSLEADGFVIRKQDETDKRILLVYPTKKAEELLPKIREISKSWNEFLLSALTKDERDSFEVIIEKLTKRATDYVNKEVADI